MIFFKPKTLSAGILFLLMFSCSHKFTPDNTFLNAYVLVSQQREYDVYDILSHLKNAQDFSGNTIQVKNWITSKRPYCLSSDFNRKATRYILNITFNKLPAQLVFIPVYMNDPEDPVFNMEFVRPKEFPRILNAREFMDSLYTCNTRIIDNDSSIMNMKIDHSELLVEDVVKKMDSLNSSEINSIKFKHWKKVFYWYEAELQWNKRIAVLNVYPTDKNTVKVSLIEQETRYFIPHNHLMNRFFAPSFWEAKSDTFWIFNKDSLD